MTKKLFLHRDYPYLDNVLTDPRLVGAVSTLIPFLDKVSASRIEMVYKHFCQMLVLREPEFPMIFTGFERELGKYTFDKFLLDRDVYVVDILPKYNKNQINDVHNWTVVYRDENNNIGYFVIDQYYKGTDGFGYKRIFHNNLKTLRKGSLISKDTQLTRSANTQGERYCYGTNLNVAYLTSVGASEDATKISESASKKLVVDLIHKVVITIPMDHIPVAHYSTPNDPHKFMPNVGEFVEDGILCAFRKVHKNTFMADTDPTALKNINLLTDKLFVINKDAKIIDIEYNASMYGGKNKPMFDQMDIYRDSAITLNNNIVSIYREHKKKGYKFTKAFESLVTTALHKSYSYNGKKAHPILCEGKTPIEHVQITVTFTYPAQATKGFKLTDRYGAKCVVSAVVNDEEMPIDKYGTRADIICEPGSILKRLNPSQLYEHGIQFVSTVISLRMKNMTTNNAYEYVLEWITCINPNYVEIIRNRTNTRDKMEQYVDLCITHGIYIHVPPYLNIPTTPLEWITMFNIDFSHVKFLTNTFDLESDEMVAEIVESNDRVVIGKKYFILLNKIPISTAVSVAKTNSFNIPVKPDSHKKHDTYNSITPIRLGEDEVRILMQDGPVEEVVRLINLQANSPVGVRLLIETLLTNKHPTKLNRIPLTTEQLKDTSAVLSIYHTLMAFKGIDSLNTTKTFETPLVLSNLQEIINDYFKTGKIKTIGEINKDDDTDEDINNDTDESDDDENSNDNDDDLYGKDDISDSDEDDDNDDDNEDNEDNEE